MEHRILARYPIGNPRRRWKQDHFILSNFSAKGSDMRKAIRHCAEVGFNLLELGWAKPAQAEEAVALCEQLGVDLIYQNMYRYGGMQHHRFYRKNELKELIREKRAWKRIAGYYIWDEPLLDDQLAEARMLTDQCQEEAPDLLPFTVAIPSYNTEYTWDNGEFPAYLERFITTIDPPQLSLDYYPVGMPEHNAEVQFDRSRMWCDLGLMKKLGEQYDMPIWFYYQGQNLHKVELFTFPMIRAMMYAGVLYGAKGLQHYTACGSIIDSEGNKDIFFAEQKAIHREFRELGPTLMALTCRRVIHDESVDPGCAAFKELHNTAEESAWLSGALPARVSVAEYEDAYGNSYMLVLNRDYTVQKTVELPLKKAVRIYEVSKEDGLQYITAENTDVLRVTLDAGDAVLLRLQDAAEAPFTAEYRLVK
ncbi:MAG: hypothetical protein IJ412_12150 [Oscillospiraceae bacterium]|nr:hypothetical protein [Oscillospiraceae bacterium]